MAMLRQITKGDGGEDGGGGTYYLYVIKVRDDVVVT